MSARGNFHFNGYGGYPKDMAQVAHWWHMAGEWGSLQALENLTLSYWDGRAGFPKDYKKAFAAAHAAAEIGSEGIADSIGRMYYQGHGTPVNYEAAIPYLIDAAHQDKARSIACLIRALWFGQGTEMDHDDAKEWLNHLREIDREEYDDVKSTISGPIAWIRVLIAKFKGRKTRGDE